MRALLILLAVFIAAAAPPPGRREAIHVPVWVQTGAARSESSLAPETLKVTLGGAPAKPAIILGPKDDLMLLVVADLTSDITLAEMAKRALDEKIDKLPSNAMVSLLRAQDGLRVLVDATTEREPLKAAINGLPVSGKAGLLETIATMGALGDAILAKASVRLAVLYVTDSDVSNYREDFTNPTINWSDSSDISRRFRDSLVRERISKLDAALAAAETPFFIVHVAYRTDTLNQAYQTGLSTLAATTGGASYFCRTQGEVPDTIAKVFDTIVSHYSLKIPSPANDSKTVDVILDCPGHTLNWRNRFTLAK
jgi:hypothetical protein